MDGAIGEARPVDASMTEGAEPAEIDPGSCVA